MCKDKFVMKNDFVHIEFGTRLLGMQCHISLLRLAQMQAVRENRISKIENTWFSIWSDLKSHHLLTGSSLCAATLSPYSMSHKERLQKSHKIHSFLYFILLYSLPYVIFIQYFCYFTQDQLCVIPARAWLFETVYATPAKQKLTMDSNGRTVFHNILTITKNIYENTLTYAENRYLR